MKENVRQTTAFVNGRGWKERWKITALKNLSNACLVIQA
jgi:hypothetical protein